jgi:hypothetical protein
MELFRVGGDVPDTNYLFMGMNMLQATSTETDVVQAISLTAVSILSNPSFFCYALKYDTQTE